MLKLVFLVSILITMTLNLTLAYYLIRNQGRMHADYRHGNEMVSFDLLPLDEGKEQTAATEILETEVLGFNDKKE